MRVADPIALFEEWFAQARETGVTNPDTMTLATATRGGIPSARMVLFKGLSRGAFRFFTNYESRKARELDKNPRAALVFYWEKTQKQIRIEGTVTRTSRPESDAYFSSRERGSQIGAWASDQSRIISGGEVLESRTYELEKKYNGHVIPRPPHWGGYRVVPDVIEFWQGREHRLHERTRFNRKGTKWTSVNLAP